MLNKHKMKDLALLFITQLFFVFSPDGLVVCFWVELTVSARFKSKNKGITNQKGICGFFKK